MREYSRDCEECITIQMVGLNALLGVLEDDLDEGAVFESDNIGLQNNIFSNVLRRVIGNNVVLKHLLRNSKVLSELNWGFPINMRNAVNSVTELPTIPANRVNELHSAGDVNLAVMVRALWGGPGCRGR